MRKVYGIATVLAIIIVSRAAARSQEITWRQTSGPEGGGITVLGQSRQGSLFAGTGNHGLFRSTDNGEHWSKLAIDTSGWQTDLIYTTPDGALFLHIEAAGLLRSTDDGDTWKTVQPDLNRTVSMAVDSSGGLLAASSLSGLYRSTDGGENWKPAFDTVLREITAMGVTRDGAIIAGVGTGPNTFGSPGSLMRSTDNGASWGQLDTFNGFGAVTSVIVLDNTILASTDGTGIFRSTDNGTNWSICDTATTMGRVAPLHLLPDGRIVAGIYERGLARSSDEGATWTLDRNAPAAITSVLVRPDNLVFLGSATSGVYRSTGDLSGWIERNSGIINHQVHAIAATRDHIFAATATGTVFRTGDRGEHWEKLPINDPIAALATTPKSTIIALVNPVAQNPAGSMLRSTDAGATWIESTSFPKKVYVNDFAVDRDGTLYMAANGLTQSASNLYRSTDDGISWETMKSDFINQIRSITVGGGYLVVLQHTGENVINRIGSSTWRSFRIDLEPGDYEYSIAVTPSGTVFAGTNRGVWRSTNYGTSWEKTSKGIDSQFVRELYPMPDGSIYASPDPGGLFRSTDNGDTWSDAAAGLKGRYIIVMAMDSAGYLYAGTQSEGVFRGEKRSDLDVDLPAIHEVSSSLSVSPNPSNSTTTISFELSVASDVRLGIFDLTGRNVATLRQQMEVGNHSVNFDTSKLPGGVYLCRLEAGDLRLSRMIVVVR